MGAGALARNTCAVYGVTGATAPGPAEYGRRRVPRAEPGVPGCRGGGGTPGRQLHVDARVLRVVRPDRHVLRPGADGIRIRPAHAPPRVRLGRLDAGVVRAGPPVSRH